MTENVRIVLAEDHPVFRDGLRAILEDEGGFEVIAEAENGQQALELVQRLQPEVLIADLQLPGVSGLDVARALRRLGGPTRVLVLSAYHHAEYVRSALEAGAAGYLVKEEPAERIVAAVRGIARGQKGWLSRVAAAQLHQPEADVLTPKEAEVVRRLAAGSSLLAVAAALDISHRTVRNHLNNVYGKLDLHSQAEVVAWAWKTGLMLPGDGDGPGAR